jgi:hypothetical protein
MTTPTAQTVWVCSTPSPPGTTWRFGTEAEALSFARIVAATPAGSLDRGFRQTTRIRPAERAA